MKRYQEYMDSVAVSDTLHEKLKRLDRPTGKGGSWKKYATAAAALVLVIGIGAVGLGRHSGGNTELGAHEAITTEPATEPNLMPGAASTQTMGGYELRQGEMASYFLLPAIRYAATDGSVAADIALPDGVTRRDLTADELEGLFGGADHLRDHLDWSGYELSAFAMVWPDGDLWLLCINGSAGDTGMEHFTMEVMPGELPPTCYVYSGGEVNEIWGQEVTAEKHDGEAASSRRVSFLRGGYGYRFEITGADAGKIETLTSRLVRWIVAGDGLLLNQNKDVPADVPSLDASDVPSSEIEETQEARTYPYDPTESE